MSQVIGFEEALKLFGTELAHRAMAQALNRASNRAKTVQANAVAEVYNVRKPAVKRTIIQKKASPQRLSGALISISRQLPLIEFKPTATSSGVRYSIRRRQPRFHAHAFINKLSKGREGSRRHHLGVGVRVPGSQAADPPKIQRGPRKGQPWKREKIKQLMGVSIAHLTDNPDVIDGVIADMQRTAPQFFDKALRAIINREIKKLNR